MFLENKAFSSNSSSGTLNINVTGQLLVPNE